MSEPMPSVEEFADTVARQLQVDAEAMRETYQLRGARVDRWRSGELLSKSQNLPWKALMALGSGGMEVRAAAWMDLVQAYMCGLELQRRQEAATESRKGV